jgi:hypothetical protein
VPQLRTPQYARYSLYVTLIYAAESIDRNTQKEKLPAGFSLATEGEELLCLYQTPLLDLILGHYNLFNVTVSVLPYIQPPFYTGPRIFSNTACVPALLSALDRKSVV